MKNQNLKVPQREIMNGYKAVLAAISHERGLEEIAIHDEAIKTPTFIDYLELLQSYTKRKLAIFMDGLQVHKAHLV